MSISKPYHRIWRPVKGYNWSEAVISRNDNNVHIPTHGYLYDERFACQAEMGSLVTTAHLVVRDLYEVFNYIEPNDDNNKTYSHRIYELFLRTATEFESNCKGILRANCYSKSKTNAEDYFKIAAAARLSDYRISFTRWSTNREFKPFAEWNSADYKPLPWYQDYNSVKHNRFEKYNLANFGNLMNAIAGLLCILHAQIGEEMDNTCYEGFSTSQSVQGRVSNDTFRLLAPQFPEEEQYGFIWDTIKTGQEPVQQYRF